MKTTGKRAISFLLALFLTSFVFCALGVNVKAETANPPEGNVIEKLEKVLKAYPSGSKWTKSFDGATECYGFAKLVIKEVFGKKGNTPRSWKYNGTPTTGMKKIGAVKESTAANVEALLRKARPGDVLQFDRKNSSSIAHSMIVYSVTKTGAIIYECNYYSKCGVTLNKLSFKKIADRQSSETPFGKLTLLRADNWDLINSKLGLSGFSGPEGNLSQYPEDCDLTGTFTSNYTINKVTAKVKDEKTGKKLDGLSSSVEWDSLSYDILTDGLDYAFDFSKLKAGEYKLEITAKDAAGQTKKQSTSFTVPIIPVSSITLDQTAITMMMNTNQRLTATISPLDASIQTLAWSSEDKNVVTVDKNGVITPIGPGQTTITATAKDGSGVKATCQVTVLPVPVEGVRLNKTKLTMKVGATLTLKATVMPSDATNRAVTWKSSNKNVVKVTSGGKLTALKKGTACITVKTKDGHFTAECTVTVK